MIELDSDSLICDFAEYYGIYDITVYPLRYVATLACGLRADSRIVGKIAGVEEQPPVFLLTAQLLDSVNNLTWALSGEKKHRPPSVVEMLFKRKEGKGFDTPAEFEKERARILREVKNG